MDGKEPESGNRPRDQAPSEGEQLGADVQDTTLVSNTPLKPSQQARLEALFTQGQELFSRGLYEHAINVWTRILFLDRGNILARRTIEKGKQALAERQRRLDSVVVEASGALDTGDRIAARRIISKVLAEDPRHVEGRSLFERLEALERRPDGSRPSEAFPPARSQKSLARIPVHKKLQAVQRAPLPASSPFKIAAFWFAALVLFLSGGLYLHFNWESLLSDAEFVPTVPSSWSVGKESSLPIPGIAELNYYNGARLFAKGHYRAALVELSQVDRRCACAERARGLILRIEERLLRGGPPVNEIEDTEHQSIELVVDEGE